MLIIGGNMVPTPGYSALTWKDDPSFRIDMPEDGAPRGDQRVNCGVIHTTEGKKAEYRPGVKGPHRGAQQYIQSWRNSPREAAAHILIGWDGVVYQIADLQTEMAYHTPGVNRVSIGIEIVQIDRIIYLGQLHTLALLCSQLAEVFGIQPQINLPYRGHAVPRIAQGKFYGFFSHRDADNGRGYGDCNDEPLQYLVDNAGFEAFDVEKGEDVTVWKARQKALGIGADGVPGKGTHAALKAAGYRKGLYALGK